MSLAALAGLRIDPDALGRLSPAEQEAVRDQLRVVEEEFKQNPLLGYRPHVKQQVFHSRGADGLWLPLRAFFGGNRSGKTTAAMCDTLIQAVDADAVPEHLQAYKRWEPPFKCRIMTPDFGDTHEVVLEKIREWCPRGQLKGGSFDRGYDKLKRVLWFKNGSRLHFNSNVQDREQLGGSDLHRVLYDEEPRRDLRVESLTRLIDHDGEEVFAMTPLEGMSWLYDEIYEPWERAESEVDDLAELERRFQMRVLVVDMDDNPHLSESGKQRALQAYSGAEREARKSGRFVSFAGLIYPEYSTSRHVVPDEDTLPENVELFEGLDPGLRHMAAVVFCYLDESDRLVVYDELAIQGRTVAEVAKAIKLVRERWGVTPNWTVIDPSSRNRNSQTGRSDQQEYVDCGIVTFPGQNDVRAGINRVRQRFESDPPKLLISARCEQTRSQLKKYRWMKDNNRSENAPAERPVKKDDHLLDAVRYVCMQRPLAPDPDMPRENDTMKDRLLRHHLKKLTRKPQMDSGFGPGIFQ